MDGGRGEEANGLTARAGEKSALVYKERDRKRR